MSVPNSPTCFHIDPQTLSFDLPEDLIAQDPLPVRDQARLLVLNRSTGLIEHRLFSDLPAYLKEGDVLVLNKTRVNKAKVLGRKPTGGRVEVIFLERTDDPHVWKALVRPFMKAGTRFVLAGQTPAELEGRTADGECRVRCHEKTPDQVMELEGRIPLPPYIKRAPEEEARNQRDEEAYQTVYASAPGSVAAPTAGLHFSASLINQLKENGVRILEILLHVGWGTFKPISGTVDRHQMLPERYEVREDVFEELLQARQSNRRIITVGTTSTRTLESLAMERNSAALQGETSLFITPGFQFNWISGLITNFHVPRSTPIALTAAFAGLNRLERAYEEAIRLRYRFYSYGDGMIVL